MTTTIKDITEYLDVKGVYYNPIRLSALLAQLDWEQLEDLLNIFRDLHDYSDGFDRGYSEGHAEGYDQGFVAGVDSTCE